MSKQFKPVRFFVIMGVLAFVVCGAVAFFTARAATGRSPDERAGYAVGMAAAKAEPASAPEPRPFALHNMADAAFAKQSGAKTGERAQVNAMMWKAGFQHGYEEGRKKSR